MSSIKQLAPGFILAPGRHVYIDRYIYRVIYIYIYIYIYVYIYIATLAPAPTSTVPYKQLPPALN